MGEDRKTCCLSISLYVHNILLIVKGLAWITYVISAFLISVPQYAIVGGFGQSRNHWAASGDLLPALIPISILIFGITSLNCGITGIIGTPKKHYPTTIVNAVALLVLLMLEAAFYTMLGVYRVLPVTNGLLWVGVVSALLSLVTFSLTLAWQAHIKQSKGGDKMQLIPNAGTDRASGSSMEGGTKVLLQQMELGKLTNLCQVEGLRVIIISAISFSVAITMVIIITIYFRPPQEAEFFSGRQGGPSQQTSGFKKINNMKLHGAVACDAPVCAAVGTEILKDGGSSVDAAIAATFCMSVVHPFAAGIGGGGYLIIRDNKKDESTTIDARETAPGYAARDMYEKRTTPLLPAMTIATPGLLAGLELAHQQYGNLPWSTLIQPAIKLANKTGFTVTSQFIESLVMFNEKELQEFVMLHQFIMQKSRMPMEGDTFFNRDLADTLNRIAKGGAKAFYSILAKDIVKQIEDLNGILKEEDFKNYQALNGKPLETTYNDMIVQSVAPPGGGVIVLMMLNVMDALRMKTEKGSAGLDMHWFIEAQKFSGVESGHFGDPKFAPDVYNITARMISKAFAYELAKAGDPTQTHQPQWYSDIISDAIMKLMAPGTCTVTVIGADENMVSISMSLGHDWGSLVMTANSGIILNDQMRSFTQKGDLPMDPYNRVEPLKRPASYIAPSLVFSRKKPSAVRMALGGGGGNRSTAAVVQVIRKVISLGDNLRGAITAPRVYAPLIENLVYYEDMANNTLSPDVLQYLEDVGHQLVPIKDVGSTVNAVAKINETLTAQGDPRNGGGASVF